MRRLTWTGWAAATRIVGGVAIAAFSSAAHAQTLTPPRGLFSYAERLQRDTEGRRDAAKDSLILGVNVDAALRSYFDGTPTSRPNLSSGGASIQAATYSGNFVIAINAGTASEGVASRFGKSLLQPLTLSADGRGLGLLLDYRHLFLNAPGKFPYSRLGLHAYGSGANTTWNLTESGGTSSKSIDGNITAIGLQLSGELLNTYLSNTPISAVVDFGVAFRHLGGELGSRSNGPIVSTALGTSARNFTGIEGDATIHISDVHLGIGVYVFPGDVAELSNVQYTFGVSAGAAFLSGHVLKSVQTLRSIL